ncbi:alpha/beta hydrolase family protein, partial [Staphylococcus warneri]|uniref:alpha/beta hydrolase family protein n=1 Tax=Staphylococcus warneri TaxID=1292 RepID=UPI000D3F8724
HAFDFGTLYRGIDSSVGKIEVYGSDLRDVTLAIRLLHHMYRGNPFHMIRISRGGLQGLLTFQDLPVTSYIIWGGVSDINLMYEERIDLRGMLKRMIGHPKKNIEAYKRRDAIAQIKNTSPPIFIVHGGK